MVSEVLALVKARLGISTAVRDVYLIAIIEGVMQELSGVQGLILNPTDKVSIMFVADYAEYRYSNRDNPAMPRHLQFRLHNLMVNNKAITINNVVLVEALPIAPETNTAYILTNGTMQSYIDGVWTLINMVDGLWVIV
ncbi:MAG: hypothetical protein AB7E42_03255 [Anaerotignaceae bacterium]